MPKSLAEKFEEALSDTELLALNADIATVDALLTEVLTEVAGGDLRTWFSEVKKVWGQLWVATNREDAKGLEAARGKIEALLGAGAQAFEVYGRFLDLTEQKRKLVDTETKRRMAMEEVIRAEDAAIKFRALALAIKKHEDDPETLRAIADEYARIVGFDYLEGASTD